MRLGLILTLAFLLIASFVALVGYLYSVTSDTVQLEIELLRRSSIDEVLGAAEMRLELQASQVAAQQIIAERYRLLAEPDHETGPVVELAQSIDVAEDSLEDFEKRLEKSWQSLRAGTEIERRRGDLERADREREAAEEWLVELQKELATHQTLMKRFIHLAHYHPSDQVSEFLLDELQPHYEDTMLPLIRRYEKQVEAALEVQLATMESVHRAANRRNIVVTLLAAAIAVALGLAISRSISRPLAALQDAALRVGKGDLDSRIELRTRNEIGVLGAAFNQMVGDLKATTVSLEEKEVLLKEVHHRVKNNLQIISSLLNLQGDLDGDPRAARLLRESRNRIRSMALIHEQLYQSEDLAKIDFAEYVERLARFVVRSHGAEGQAVDLRLEVDPSPLEVDRAIPCGMILNELVANAIEHAFPARRGEITVRFGLRDGGYRLSVADNGVGFPPGFDPGQAASLGLRLVRALAQQLGGELEFSSGDGCRVTVRFAAEGTAAPPMTA